VRHRLFGSAHCQTGDGLLWVWREVQPTSQTMQSIGGNDAGATFIFLEWSELTDTDCTYVLQQSLRPGIHTISLSKGRKEHENRKEG
jgi:hypothetical protein